MSEVYPGSGMKVRPKQSMRTPQQHLPLKLDDRTKRSRASNSFVVADLTDMDTPRTNVSLDVSDSHACLAHNYAYEHMTSELLQHSNFSSLPLTPVRV